MTNKVKSFYIVCRDAGEGSRLSALYRHPEIETAKKEAQRLGREKGGVFTVFGALYSFNSHKPAVSQNPKKAKRNRIPKKMNPEIAKEVSDP